MINTDQCNYAHPKDLYCSKLGIFLLPEFSVCLTESAFLPHVHSHTSPTIFFLFIYQVLLFAPANLLSQCSRLTKNWRPGFHRGNCQPVWFLRQWREKKKTLPRHPIGTRQANGSNKIGQRRRRRLRQIQKAWRLYEKGAGGCRDERRQASQQSTAPLTPMQLYSSFYQYQLKAKQIRSRESRHLDHLLYWQPCMLWQHQSLFLLNQCAFMPSVNPFFVSSLS